MSWTFMRKWMGMSWVSRALRMETDLSLFSYRAPFGLFYHAAWFTQPHHKEGFISFLDTIVAMDDVWVVTNWQALQWVRNPTPTEFLDRFEPFGCNYPVSCFIFISSWVFSDEPFTETKLVDQNPMSTYYFFTNSLKKNLKLNFGSMPGLSIIDNKTKVTAIFTNSLKNSLFPYFYFTIELLFRNHL